MQNSIKKSLSLGVSLLLALFASTSLGEIDTKIPTPINNPDLNYQGYFIAAHGGFAIPNKSTNILNNGYSAGGEYGYYYDNYRAFVEMDYINHNFDNPSIATYNVFDLTLNLVYDINYDGIIIPFLGGGLGYLDAWQSRCSSTFSNCNQLNTDARFAYQGILGLGFRFNHFRVDLRYRYLSFFNNNNYADNIPEVVLSYYFTSGRSAI